MVGTAGYDPATPVEHAFYPVIFCPALCLLSYVPRYGAVTRPDRKENLL